MLKIIDKLSKTKILSRDIPLHISEQCRIINKKNDEELDDEFNFIMSHTKHWNKEKGNYDFNDNDENDVKFEPIKRLNIIN